MFNCHKAAFKQKSRCRFRAITSIGDDNKENLPEMTDQTLRGTRSETLLLLAPSYL